MTRRVQRPFVEANRRREECPFCGRPSTHVVKLGPVPPAVESNWELWRVHTCATDAATMVRFQRSGMIPAHSYRYRRLTRD